LPTIKSKSKNVSKLVSNLTKAKVKVTASSVDPVWAGPESNADNGGITQSMISQFLCCRERFRLRVVEGLGEPDTFNHRIEYGQMWHTCEEAFAKDPPETKASNRWQGELKLYCQDLCKKYPLQQEQIQHWYNVCKTQFPIYVEYWRKHDKKCKRTPLLQEETFKVPYKLPSGRVVYLRGKWDSVDLEGKSDIYLQENKSKGNINEQQLQRQLLFDLQTMIYMIALENSVYKAYDRKTTGIAGTWNSPIPEAYGSCSIKGLRYNVVRRPLAGGKGSISQKKGNAKTPPETNEEFYARLAGVIQEQPEYFFMRWKVEVMPSDIERFKVQFLNPCLEHICLWWKWVSSGITPFVDGATTQFLHYRLPYGIYNAISEGGSTPTDEYLASGSEVGLVRGKKLFTELM